MEERTLAEAQDDLRRLVEEAAATQARFAITRDGERVAVLLSADDFDSLMETRDVLSDADLVQQVHDSLDSDEPDIPGEQVHADFKGHDSHGQ
ncbi:MAG: type II toxin-antitoxin system Phd/YefM family antitoxin [Nocardiaceae bacterium]|nr:type II toxin-antitoxin system Phd/YefM family antitoxin [Nocardiaceae bacterium]